MPPWVLQEIEANAFYKAAADWEPYQFDLSDEFRTLMPGTARALDSARGYTALFPPLGDLPSRKRCQLFTRVGNRTLVWEVFPVETVRNHLSRGLTLFMTEVGRICFFEYENLGAGWPATDCGSCEGYTESRASFLLEEPTPDSELFPCHESVLVYNRGEAGFFVEYEKRIYLLSVASGDYLLRELSAGPGMLYRASFGAYASESVVTFADLADYVFAWELQAEEEKGT